MPDNRSSFFHIRFSGHVCRGVNSDGFQIIADGHQANSRVYILYKDSLLRVG